MSDSRGGCPLAAVPCSVLGLRRGALHRPGTGWYREVPGPGRREGGGRRIHGRHRTPGLAGLVQPVPATGSPPVPAVLAALGWAGGPLREAPGGFFFPALRRCSPPAYGAPLRHRLPRRSAPPPQ